MRAQGAAAESRPRAFRGMSTKVETLSSTDELDAMYVCVSIYVLMYLYITAQSGPVILCPNNILADFSQGV